MYPSEYPDLHLKGYAHASCNRNTLAQTHSQYQPDIRCNRTPHRYHQSYTGCTDHTRLRIRLRCRLGNICSPVTLCIGMETRLTEPGKVRPTVVGVQIGIGLSAGE